MNAFPPVGAARQRILVLCVIFAISAAYGQPSPSSPKKATSSRQEPVDRNSTTAANASDETLVLSPFEVKAETRGYYATTTMSGTRLNTKIEDLASSISVVTKEQMEDFGLLDINDIFSYEAGTEGTGNYTDFSIDRRGNLVDNVVDNPQGANRIRGMGPANTALGNFATSGWMPIDPIMLDSVEISRGPNSNIFGLGNASGTVNTVPSTGNLSRNRTEAAFRADTYGGYRTSLDFNRVLIQGKLAARGSAVFQRDGYVRKPSGVDEKRFNAMVRWDPFKNTTIKGAFFTYAGKGTRPNAEPPKDGISYWQAAGSPTWDPVTSTAHVGGRTLGPFSTTDTLPDGLRTNQFMNRSALDIDLAGLGWWGVQQTSTATNPSSANGPLRMLVSSYDPYRLTQPLYTTWPSVSDRSLYDWKKINLSAVNRIDESDRIGTLEVEQIFLNKENQLLAAQVGWMREHGKRYDRNIVGRAAGAGIGGLLSVDVNERLIDGSPNPYFLRPYMEVPEPVANRDYNDTDLLRGQIAYKLDFSKDKGWTRWLGENRIVGYSEYNDNRFRTFRYRDVMRDVHSFVAAGNPRGNQATPAGATVARGVFKYYVGDSTGQNVDYAPADFAPGVYPFHWFNGTTKQWVTENAELGEVATTDNSGGTKNHWTELKTVGAVWQSHLFDGRIVPTLGARQDRIYTQYGATPALNADGLDFDYKQMRSWTGTWLMGSGYTKSAGVVVRPLRWLSLHVNKSDSFTPTAASQNLLRQRLPNPTGKGVDYGFGLNLMGGKLVINANQYEVRQKNSPFGQSGTYAQRILSVDYIEFNNGSGPSLDNAIRAWTVQDATNHGQTLTTDQVEAAVNKTMQLTPQDYAAFQALPITDVADTIATGREIEINYNPNSFWTLRANITHTIARDVNLSPALLTWAAQRLPIWQSVRNPVTGALWWTTPYSSTNTPQSFYAGSVVSPIQVDEATGGLSRSQIRPYRANLNTSYKLAGITGQNFLRHVTVGGALRWEDKATIGYYGVQSPPAIVTDLDPNRPIYDKSHYYVDLFLSYRTRLFSDRVGARFQFNVVNLGEDGRLQPIGTNPSGVITTTRIIDPQKFVFSTSFDL